VRAANAGGYLFPTSAGSPFDADNFMAGFSSRRHGRRAFRSWPSTTCATRGRRWWSPPVVTWRWSPSRWVIPMAVAWCWSATATSTD